MADHMTAEQLRAELTHVASEFDKYAGMDLTARQLRIAVTGMADDIRDIAARLPGMAADTWQPIETAPRDRSVLVHSPSHGILEAKWSDWLEMFLADRICGLGLPEADGWREIPAAPEPPHV